MPVSLRYEAIQEGPKAGCHPTPRRTFWTSQWWTSRKMLFRVSESWGGHSAVASTANAERFGQVRVSQSENVIQA